MRNCRTVMKVCFLASIMLGIVACQEEIEPQNPKIKNGKAKVEKEIKNGRFVFSSKASLEKTIKNFQEKDVEEVEQEFETLYKQGFRSLQPIVNPDNIELQTLLSKDMEITHRTKSENSEEEDIEEEMFPDPYFAAVINNNKEIIVNDTLYKFTEDKGLFFAAARDSLHLLEYVKNSKRKTKAVMEGDFPENERSEFGGITNIDDKIYRYLRPIEEDEIYGNGGGYHNAPSYPKTDQDIALQERINNLPVSRGHKGTAFQRLFGKVYQCKSYFDRKHRIKTEFWDQSWLIYKSVGVQTKTQRKRCWIWWKSKSDEIHLGINYIRLRYKYPAPQITSFTHPNLFTYKRQAPLYLYNGRFHVKDSYDTQFVETQIEVTENQLPFLKFGNSDLLNIYIPKVPIVGDINIDVDTDDVISPSTIKSLYSLGINFLKSSFGSDDKKFIVTSQINENEIDVFYFGEHYKKTNSNKIKRKFYGAVSFEIGAALGSGGWKFSFKPLPNMFRKYTEYDVDFYGMARRGQTWKGNRIQRLN